MIYCSMSRDSKEGGPAAGTLSWLAGLGRFDEANVDQNAVSVLF